MVLCVPVERRGRLHRERRRGAPEASERGRVIRFQRGRHVVDDLPRLDEGLLDEAALA